MAAGQPTSPPRWHDLPCLFARSPGFSRSSQHGCTATWLAAQLSGLLPACQAGCTAAQLPSWLHGCLHASGSNPDSCPKSRPRWRDPRQGMQTRRHTDTLGQSAIRNDRRRARRRAFISRTMRMMRSILSTETFSWPAARLAIANMTHQLRQTHKYCSTRILKCEIR